MAEMSNGCIVLDKKMCPDPLEALKPSGDPKYEIEGSGGVHLAEAHLCPMWDPHLYGLRTQY